MTLYEELLNALWGRGFEIFSERESKEIISLITDKIEFTWYERIDFSKAKSQTLITEIKQLEKLLDKAVYLFWDDAEYNLIKTTLKNIFDCWDDVSCLGTRTWIISVDFDFFLEFYDELWLGFKNDK